jgi:hypothetical protein
MKGGDIMGKMSELDALFSPHMPRPVDFDFRVSSDDPYQVAASTNAVQPSKTPLDDALASCAPLFLIT